MALILGVFKGGRFYIEDTPVQVLGIDPPDKISLRVDGRKYVITDKESVEIYPKVFVSCGAPAKGKDHGTEYLPRLVIEAPREITILRERLYAKQRDEVFQSS